MGMLLLLFCAQLALSLPAQAQATANNCSTYQLPASLNLISHINSNSQNGEVINGSRQFATLVVNCSAKFDDGGDGNVCNGTTGWAFISDEGAVYDTAIPYTYRFPGFPPGIGYQALDQHGNPIPIVQSSHDRHDTGVRIRQGYQEIPLAFQLVKLDDSIPSESDFQFRFKVVCNGNEYANRDVNHSRIYVNAHVTSVAQTCRLENPDIQITLPTISSSQLGSAGDTGGGTHFAMKLDCMKNVTAKVFFSDVNYLPNGGSILMPSISTTAGGVAVQMRHAGEPVMLVPGGAATSSGTFIDVKTTDSSEHISVPLEAEYIQSGSTVTAGLVEAQAMVTISYE
ncbi:fimbrial protein [Halomonas cupida]|nr:fimbrial protein [Halomonas cupida]